ncbi:MAG: serine/threonine protein kinase [Gemmatimonadetes bacterium]|nr:serine/threonine protein kinase [Gemmatimonadota bacterium]
MTAAWNRVETLFEAALARGPAGRGAWLTEACAGDAELRREVEALLDADAACSGGDFLQGRISAAVEALVAVTDASRVGEVVGAYRLTGELGHGGMGRVYLAERVDRQYRAEVAIKFVQGALANPALVARFRAERQILADLTHPGIARLLDGGAAPDGTPFLVMERIAGLPIDRFADTQGLGLPERLRLFLQVCRAVEHAHQALVVHRDLKPSNIMVTEAGEAKLLDFGIATLVDPSADGEETTMLRALTPAYASPEQVRGARATMATDVYSLGVVLYRLLAGREPFHLRGLTPGQVERVLAETEPERPSTAARRARDGARLSWAGALAGDLDTIVGRAMGKTPVERYATVAALREDLERHLDGRPVLARPASAGYRLGKFVRRYHREVVTGVLALAALVALTVWYVTRLAAERDRARLEAAKASEVAGFLQELFEVSDPSVARGETVTARELLDRASTRIDEDLAGQPAVQATMLRVMGSVYGSLGLSDRARPILERSLAVHRGLYGGPHPETATTELLLGITRQDLGDVKGAEPLIRSALATRTALYGAADTSVTEAQAHLAYLLETVGEYAAAESLLVEALRVNRRLYPPQDPAIVRSVARLGGLLRRMDKSAEAEPLLREALAAGRAVHGERHLAVASIERNLAALLRDKGGYAEADSLYRLALATRRALLGESHPEVATTLNSHALLLQAMGDTLGAVAVFEEFVRVTARAYAAPHPSLAAGYNNLGYALLDAGRFDAAVASFQKALALQDQVLRRGHANRAHPLVGLGLVRMRQGRVADAESFFRRALAIRRNALPAGHRDVGEALSDLGAALAALRRFSPAESALVEARGILLVTDGATGSRTERAERRLAALYEAWGRPDSPESQRLPLPPTGAERGGQRKP